MKFWIIDATNLPLSDKSALAAWLLSHPLTDKQIVVEGDEVEVTPRVDVKKKGDGTPATKRTPTDTAARDALDMKVLAFLHGCASTQPATLEQVANHASITKPEATAALQRLKKGGKVHSPGRNQWAAKAKEASSAT